jgi:ELWxxDGT repeat protein
VLTASFWPPYRNPRSVYDLGNGTWLFSAEVSGWGWELFRTDGTTVSIVKDIGPGSWSGTYLPSGTVFKNKLYFPADDGIHGNEPWVSDGTEAGTKLVFDTYPGSGSASVPLISVLGDKLLIFSYGQLWVSNDGTTLTSVASVSDPQVEARIGTTLFFTAVTAAAGRELWMTDGTGAGTKMVADIRPGRGSGVESRHLAALGSFVYFAASDDGLSFDLWRSNGTTAGTQRVMELSATLVKAVVASGSFVYVQSESQLWRSDGTAAGTILVDSGSIRDTTAAYGRAYYFRDTEAASELWSADGSGKSRVAVLPVPAAGGDRPGPLTAVGGRLYFAASDERHGTEPWISEGTEASTRLLANLAGDTYASSSPDKLTAVGDVVFFTASGESNGRQLWRSNGTSTGTFRLTSLTEQAFDFLTSWRGALYFGGRASQLWRSGGTVETTALIRDLPVAEIFAGNAQLYFRSGEDGWRSDGTTAGTAKLLPDAPYRTLVSPQGFTEHAGKVWFVATGPDNRHSFWATEGTAESTKIVARTDRSSGAPAVAAGAIFYSDWTEATGFELWRSDGSEETERMVKDLVPGAESSGPRQFTPAGRYLYFVARDPVNGVELWRTDGSSAGTILLRDIRPGSSGSGITALTAAGSMVWFVADDGVHGAEVWRSDGTPAGTVMVADLRAGIDSSQPHGLTFAAGSLWFGANDGTNGDELWRLTGDVLTMVADLAPGAASSTPSGMVQAGQLLYFAASTAYIGYELWALPLTAAESSVLRVDDVRVTEGNSGTRTARFTVTRTGSTGAASVAFATMNGTATAGSDYVAASGTVTFAAGQTARFIDVTVSSDTNIEENEAFFVVLSSPSGAVIGRSTGTAVIAEDDRRAELSVELVPAIGHERVVRVTNAGPSTATAVTIRFSSSPGAGGISRHAGSVRSGNPGVFVLDSIRAGQSLDVAFAAGQAGYMVDPGFTVTASVTAAELDANAADNITSRMVSANGALVLPPSIPASGTATLTFVKNRASWAFVRFISATPNLTVTPASMSVNGGIASAPVTLTTGAQSGMADLLAQDEVARPYDRIRIPVVAPGTNAKLDVAIVTNAPGAVYGAAAAITVNIAARRHDGTLPTGLVSLVSEQGQLLVEQSLDAEATAVITRTDLPPGTTNFRVNYHGDANFNPLDGAPVAVRVSHWPTEMEGELPPMMCEGATYTLRVFVRNLATANVPAGVVDLKIAGKVVATLSLAASGVPGEAVATWSFVAPAQPRFEFGAHYRPTGTFEDESLLGQTRSIVPCIRLTAVATAVSRTSVNVTWNAIGAHHYKVFAGGASSMSVRGETTVTNFTDTNALENAARVYVVCAYDAAGVLLGCSRPDLALTMFFTDDPLRARQTRVQAAHVRELRNAVLALRYFGFQVNPNDTTPASGARVAASDITSLRTEINFHRQRVGLAAIAWTDPALARGTSIKAVHFQELRNAVK